MNRGSPEPLDRSLARAVAWSAAARWISQLVSWAATVVIARILTPYDYGIMGMAGLYLNLATLIGQAGVRDAIIALRDLTAGQIAELNSFSLLLGAGLVGVSCALALPIARFFSAVPLVAVIATCSVVCLFSSLQIIPRALLEKDLRFRLLASIETVRAFSQIILTVLLAWLHFRYWSLVIGYVASSAVSSLLTVWQRPHGFAVPNFGQLRRELRFSFQVMASGIASYAYNNADFGVAGRVLGEAPLGNYTVAWTISSAPIEKIGNLFTGVTPAFFSAVQHDKSELSRYLLRLTEVLSFVTVPSSIGIALSADYLVPVLLGSKWLGVIGPLRLLGILVAVRSVTTILPNLLNAIGDAKFVMSTTIAAAIVMPLAFLIGSRWGTNGIAAAWVIAFPPIILPMYCRVFQKTGTRTKEYLSAVKPAFSASVIMTAAVLLTRLLLPRGFHPMPELLSIIAVGVVSYAGALLVFYRRRVFLLIRGVKEML
jgi:O-antigen/teichoic acid export membrane protein